MCRENKKINRIGIDARMYGPIGKGLGRYTKEAVDNILALDVNNYYVIFLRKENFHLLKTENPNVKKIIVDVKWYSLAEQIIMPYYIRREKIDLMHFPHFNVPILNTKKFVVTIHDLILTKFSTRRATTLNPIFYFFKNVFYKLIIYSAIKRAKKIIAVSNFTKSDIIKQFRAEEEKIKVIYEGVANDLKIYKLKDDKEVKLRYNITTPYLLYVGNAYPHKNLEGLVEVFAKIRKKYLQLNLILVGKEDYFYSRLKKEIRRKGQAENIKFTGYVPDRDLAAIYKGALFYVFPSFYEGFGLPPLEAMEHGCPVLSSKETCLKEILGRAALYFDPNNKEDMKNKIIRIIEDRNLRQELIEKGYKQVKKYSWKECARKTLAVYNTL